MNRRQVFVCFALATLLLGGCSAWTSLTMSSDERKAEKIKKKRDTHDRLVGDVCIPYGMFPVRVEAVGWVTGLHGTGSDPEPSPQRAVLVDEMQKRGVDNPNTLLASHNASMVLVRGVLPPGIQKGDHFDVEVRAPNRSETTSLRGGYLLEARLCELTALRDGMIHSSRDRGIAQGPVLVDPTADSKSEQDRSALCRGQILGGGISFVTRELGLVMTPEHNDVVVTSRVAAAVSRRFHTYQKGIQVGVAKAHTDFWVELAVYPLYKDNLERYMHVVRAIAIQETASQQAQRIIDLERKLFSAKDAARAAVELEAIGRPGVDTLMKGMQSSDREVQFYSAEALAYLGRREAAEPLGRIARDEPAFRKSALSALAALDDPAAAEQLHNLLATPSAETRYGAFRALWTANPNDPVIKGEQLGGQFSYHVLDAAGAPMIHVTRSSRAEVVLFGRQQTFSTPLSINAGNQIMITSSSGGEISVSKFSVHDADQKRVVSNRVDDVIRAIVELGGTYPDVVQAIQEAKAAGALPSRFEVETMPEGGRKYQRPTAGEANDAAPQAKGSAAAEGPGERQDGSQAARLLQ